MSGLPAQLKKCADALKESPDGLSGLELRSRGVMDPTYAVEQLRAVGFLISEVPGPTVLASRYRIAGVPLEPTSDSRGAGTL